MSQEEARFAAPARLGFVADDNHRMSARLVIISRTKEAT